MNDYRLEGREGFYWVYPIGTPSPFGSRMVGAVGIISSVNDGWIARPVRHGCEVRGWGWRAPTRRQAFAQLYAWLNGDDELRKLGRSLSDRYLIERDERPTRGRRWANDQYNDGYRMGMEDAARIARAYGDVS